MQHESRSRGLGHGGHAGRGASTLCVAFAPLVAVQGALAVAAVLLVAGCGSNQDIRYGWESDGAGTGGSAGTAGTSAGGSAATAGTGAGGSAGTAGTGAGGSAGTGGDDDCFDAAKQVYLVNDDYAFLKFEPQTMTFTRLGALRCPAGTATPNSMAVDRSGTAWVNYSDGSIFHVDIETLACKATAFEPNQQGFGMLGMGFVSDAPGSSAESLFVTDGGKLGKLDTKTLVLEQIGTVQDKPEFAGNGLGELWGFSPPDQQAFQPGGLVQKFDKTSGQTIKKYDLTLEAPLYGVAWAFAFWGGSYYLFYQGPRAETDVYQFNPTDGTTEKLDERPGGRIVGASASTCAPVVPPI